MVTPPLDAVDYALAASLSIICVLVVASSTAVLRYYAGPLRTAQKRHGLLLWHIVTISSSEVLLWVGLLIAQFDILGLVETPRWTRLVVYSVAGIGKVAAIIIIARNGQRRVRSLPREYETETIVHQRDSRVIGDG